MVELFSSVEGGGDGGAIFLSDRSTLITAVHVGHSINNPCISADASKFWPHCGQLKLISSVTKVLCCIFRDKASVRALVADAPVV